MLKGYIQSKGVLVSERKLKFTLPRMSPQWHHARHQNSHERSNPSIYVARYFGHKLHLDQNEKLTHYGVTYVLARDGFSGKIVGAAVMQRKNNKIIYDEVYRACLSEYSLWDQVCVDHGREFYLILYIQEKLRNAGRGDPEIAPYVQTTSTHNHIIERIWVEVNSRVTYPIKGVVIAMGEWRQINMDDDIEKCVSYVLRNVCSVGLNRMIEVWNNHSIPQKGIPNTLQANNDGTNPINPADIPTASAAVSQYRQQGGSLTDPAEFGDDPLANDAQLCRRREDLWLLRCGGFNCNDIYSADMCGNTWHLENAILKFIEVTHELSP